MLTKVIASLFAVAAISYGGAALYMGGCPFSGGCHSQCGGTTATTAPCCTSETSPSCCETEAGCCDDEDVTTGETCPLQQTPSGDR